MILIWFCYGWFYDFDMILIWFWYGWFFVLWLCHRNLMFSVTPTTTIPKAPSPIPSCAMVFSLGPSFLRVWAPRPPRVRHSTGNPQQRTNTEPRSARSSRILNPGIWTAVILSHKHRKITSYSSYLCIFHSRLTRIIPVRPCRLFLGSLGTSLWEAWEGEKGAGQLTRMSLILTLGLTCPFSEQNGAKWYWKLASEWLTARLMWTVTAWDETGKVGATLRQQQTDEATMDWHMFGSPKIWTGIGDASALCVKIRNV